MHSQESYQKYGASNFSLLQDDYKQTDEIFVIVSRLLKSCPTQMLNLFPNFITSSS